MDSHGYYANGDIEIAADAQARDTQLLTNLVKWKRRETKATLAKADVPTGPTKENWRLKGKMESMTLHAEYAETNAFHRERQLRKEAKEVTDFATTGTMPIESYRKQIATINRLEVALKVARKATTSKEEEGSATDSTFLWQPIHFSKIPTLHCSLRGSLASRASSTYIYTPHAVCLVAWRWTSPGSLDDSCHRCARGLNGTGNGDKVARRFSQSVVSKTSRMGYEAHSRYESTSFGLGESPRRDPPKKSTTVLCGRLKVADNYHTRDLGVWRSVTCPCRCSTSPEM